MTSRQDSQRLGDEEVARTLLLVGANDETVRKATDLGLRVLVLQHPSKVTAEQRALADEVHVLDYTEWSEVEPVARRLWQAPGFAVALSLTEPGLENAGRVNDEFGLGGAGFEVARAFRDKRRMRQILAGHEGLAVPAAPLTRQEDLDEFGARHGYPFIVKPVDATASLGVFPVASPADHEDVWARVRKLDGVRTDRVSTLFVLREFMMERYIDGPELSVESFSFAGRHVVVAVTEKFLAAGGFAEMGHAVPARIAPAAEERVVACVASFLDAMGLRDGVSHTEVRLSAHGPAIIEGHNRVAGDAITELVRGAYGVDLVTYALGWPFGLVPELTQRPSAHAGASVRVLVGEPGRVVSVAGVEDARSLPGVLDVRITARPGDRVSAPRDNWDRLGLVAVTGADTSQAIERGAEVISSAIKIAVAGDDGETRLAQVAEVQAAAALAGGAA